MPDHYKLDSRKITLKEYWNIYPSWKVLIPWLAGRLNLTLGPSTSFRRPQSSRELEVSEADFPEQARASLEPLVLEFRRLGFNSPRFFTFENLRRDTRVSAVSMLHESGQCVLRLLHSISFQLNPPKQSRQVVLLSELRDGTYLCTTDQRPRFRGCPGVVTNRVVGAPPPRLFEAHRQKLAELPITNPPKSVHSAEELDTMYDRYEKVSFEFGIERGLYVPMTPAEVEAEQQIVTGAKAMSVAGTKEHADVLVQLSALQNQKPGWGSAIWILVLSLVAFVVAGTRQWSWSFVLILVPVLFIHELGHFLAMRAFHYRNLRMFFIPFFGAAVVGRHYNVPGWKKVVVSLMGPVPGILLGAIIGGAGMALNNSVLTRIAIVLLILNGSNLLPLLPLDGGWVFHALFFCRHYLLDTAFRLVAVVGLFVCGVLLHSKILTYLGIPMLLSIPLSFRMARIAAELKKRGLPPLSPDDQSLPPETAQAIITELKKTMPGKRSTKVLAQQTLQIFETLNARPPGWAATGGLLLGHLASMGMAAVLLVAFFAARQAHLLEPLTSMAREPTRSLACGAVMSWPGAHADAQSPSAGMTLIAHYKSASSAQTAFQYLTNQVPASANVKTFGNSIFLTFPADDAGLGKLWLAQLQRQSTSAFIATSNAPAMLTVAARFPTEAQAQAVAAELNGFFSLADNHYLIPPWYPGDSRTAAERAAHKLARQAYLKAEAVTSEGFDSPELSELHKQMRDAVRKSDKQQLATLQEKLRALSAQLAQERLQKLQTTETGSGDPETIGLFATWFASRSSTNQAEIDQAALALSQRMGRLPALQGTDAVDQRFSLHAGLVSRKGPEVKLSLATPVQISDGAPALLDWLCAHGGSEMKYEIVPTPSWLLDQEAEKEDP